MLRKIALAVILLLALTVRHYKLNTPLADWHSWRQVDTASVAVEYTKHGIDLLHPKFLDLADNYTGKPNPEGYRMVEFPLIPALVASLPQMLPLHVTYRLVNIVLSLISILFLYGVTRHIGTPRQALLAASVFALLPYNIYYSRTTLPEVALVTFSLATMYYFLRYWKKQQAVFLALTAVAAALALLMKPTAVFFFLPLLVLLINEKGIREIVKPKWIAVAVIALVPLILWRRWIGQYPEGMPYYAWLLNGDGIRFKGAFFHWIFAKRLGDLILGYWGLIPFGLGIVAARKPLISAWLLSMLAYVSIFATGNVHHDYYQIITIPIISVAVALGFDYLLAQKTRISYLIAGMSAVFMLSFGWYAVRGYYNINNPAIVEAGQAVDQLTPKDALIIAPYQEDTAFLYQTNRRGWATGGDIDKKIAQGASYYVTTANDDEAKELATKYQMLQATQNFILIKLSQ